MRLDNLNWNIDWQRHTVCTCPVFSSAAFHFTSHEAEMGCPAFKSIREDCSCHLFPNLKMIAAALVRKQLPRSAYRNSKLFVENGTHRALTTLEDLAAGDSPILSVKWGDNCGPPCAGLHNDL